MRLFPLLLALLIFGCLAEAPKTNMSADSGTKPAEPEIRVLKDLQFANASGKPLLLDLYLPESEKPLPLIIMVHGGGWIEGNKENCVIETIKAQDIAKKGFAIACIDYRLSNESKFPAQIYDVKAAIRWLRMNAGRYGYDPGRIGIWGISAGGHLAALAGTSGGVRELDGDIGVGGSSRVQAVVDWFGPTDFMDVAGDKVDMSRSDDHGYYLQDERHAASYLIGGQLMENPELVKMANPITYVTPDDPPFLIIHGTEDGTVPVNQSRKLYLALKEAGVDAGYIEVEGAGHGFPVPGPQYDATMAFFDRKLKQFN